MEVHTEYSGEALCPISIAIPELLLRLDTHCTLGMMSCRIHGEGLPREAGVGWGSSLYPKPREGLSLPLTLPAHAACLLCARDQNMVKAMVEP